MINEKEFFSEIKMLRTEVERLRAELAAAKEREETLISAIAWALGGNGDFRPREENDAPYYWRRELRERSGLTWGKEKLVYIDASQPKAGGEQ